MWQTQFEPGAQPNCTFTTVFWEEDGDEKSCIEIPKRFGRKSWVCENEKILTQFIFFPHGKPIHHGGCSKKYPWMMDTLDRVEKHCGDLNNVILELAPAAHFSIFNPAVYMNRLIEVRLKLYRLKLKYPEFKIIFKTMNYVPNNFDDQRSVVSAYNSKRMDRIDQMLIYPRKTVT